MNTSTLSRIIDIVHARKYDAEKIVLQLMKNNPELFLTLYDEKEIPTGTASSVTETKPEDYLNSRVNVIDLLNDNRKIESIKYVRALHNLTLREAKDLIDNCQNFANKKGLINKEYCNAETMNAHCQTIFNLMFGLE